MRPLDHWDLPLYEDAPPRIWCACGECEVLISGDLCPDCLREKWQADDEAMMKLYSGFIPGQRKKKP